MIWLSFHRFAEYGAFKRIINIMRRMGRPVHPSLVYEPAAFSGLGVFMAFIQFGISSFVHSWLVNKWNEPPDFLAIGAVLFTKRFG